MTLCSLISMLGASGHLSQVEGIGPDGPAPGSDRLVEGLEAPRARCDRRSSALRIAFAAMALLLLLESLVGSDGTTLMLCLAMAAAATQGLGHPFLWAACGATLILNGYVAPEFLARVGAGPGVWAWLPLWCLEGLLINWLLVVLHREIEGSHSSTSTSQGTAEDLHLEASDPLLLESSSQSQESFRLMVESIGDYAIVLLGPDGRIASWNVGAERIFGYTAEEVIGKNQELLFSVEDVLRGFPSRSLSRAEGEGGWQSEGWRRRKDQSRFWSQVGFTPLRNPAGKLLGFASVIRDITERKRAEESLRQARDELEVRVQERTVQLAEVNRALQAEVQERHQAQEVLLKRSNVLRSILDSIGDAIIVAEDPKKPLSFNPAAQALFGLSRNEVPIEEWYRTQPFRSADSGGLMPVDDACRPLSLALQGAEVDNLELIVVSARTREMRWVLANARPLRNPGGKSVGAVVAIRDITDRRRQDLELKQAKEAAESASRAKDRFLATLSHELRTPLTPVLLAASDLCERADLAPEVRSRLAMIERNAQLEARLIDDLLDLTRATTGRLTLNLSRVDVHSVIENAVEVCRAGILDAELELVLELAATHHHIDGDPARLQQVYWNLIKNAIKFTPKGGRIVIRSWNSHPVDAGEAEVRLVTEVSDTGIGIATDQLPRIFDAFEHKEPRLQRLHGGLGLGLAITRSVVLAHGGSLCARSDGVGQGAAFTVELTARATSPPAPAREGAGLVLRVAQDRPERLRILLVDDNRDTLRDLVSILENRGHTVTPASSYRSASRLIELYSYDLLISDIELPDGTGLDIIRDLHERQDVPGIALSGFGSADDLLESRRAGFAEHLIKPISVQSLHDAIARTLAGGAAESGPRDGRSRTSTDRSPA